jgi:hypothetical protein
MSRRLTAGLVITAGLVVAGTGAQLVNYALALDDAALDSSKDGGVFGVIGDLSLVVTALAAWIALARAHRRDWAIVALPVLLTFLSVDKTLRIHDDIAHWPRYYVPILVVTFVALVAVALRLPAEGRRLVLLGLVLLGISFFIHLTGEPLIRQLGFGQNGLAMQLKAVVKHGAEVAGWLIVALGLLAASGHTRPADRGTRAARPTTSEA